MRRGWDSLRLLLYRKDTFTHVCALYRAVLASTCCIELGKRCTKIKRGKKEQDFSFILCNLSSYREASLAHERPAHRQSWSTPWSAALKNSSTVTALIPHGALFGQLFVWFNIPKWHVGFEGHHSWALQVNFGPPCVLCVLALYSTEAFLYLFHLRRNMATTAENELATLGSAARQNTKTTQPQWWVFRWFSLLPSSCPKKQDGICSVQWQTCPKLKDKR